MSAPPCPFVGCKIDHHAAHPAPDDAAALAAALNEAYAYDGPNQDVPVLPFVDDYEAFWLPLARAALAIRQYLAALPTGRDTSGSPDPVHPPSDRETRYSDGGTILRTTGYRDPAPPDGVRRSFTHHADGSTTEEHEFTAEAWARLTAAPPAPLPLDVDAQFFAVDKSLLATFQWSDKEHLRQGLAAHGFLSRLHEIGWDVTVSDPVKAAEYTRLATPEPTDLHPIVRGKQVLMDAVPATPEPTEGERPSPKENR